MTHRKKGYPSRHRRTHVQEHHLLFIERRTHGEKENVSRQGSIA
jgi:hypothetical protein